MKLTDEMCNKALNDLPLNLKQWIVAVAAELDSAQNKFPDWPKDFVHAAAIVSEESGELVRAANLYTWEKGRYYHMHKEATQTAAMCFRFLVNATDKNV